jgi:hypothetical protein
VKTPHHIAARSTKGTKRFGAGGIRGVAEPIARYGSDRGEVVLYRTSDGSVTLEVRQERESIWLNENQVADLFWRDQSVISRRLKKVFTDGELDRDSTVAFYASVQNEAGGRWPGNSGDTILNGPPSAKRNAPRRGSGR